MKRNFFVLLLLNKEKVNQLPKKRKKKKKRKRKLTFFWEETVRGGCRCVPEKLRPFACWYEDLCRGLPQFNLDVIYLLFSIIQSHRERVMTSSRMTMAFRKFLCFCFSFRTVSRLVSLGFVGGRKCPRRPLQFLSGERESFREVIAESRRKFTWEYKNW